MRNNLAISTTLVGSMTLLSRILGFIRDMICAMYFGASPGYDAFLVAFKIPNFMRSLFAEGAFSQAFVPLLSERQATHDAQSVHAFVDHVAGCLAVILSVVSVCGVLAAPLIILLFAPGFSVDPGRYALSVSLLRITFPYLFFIALTALSGGILNTYGRYAPPALTPCLLNIAMISTTIGLSHYFTHPVMALAWGVFLGGVIQCLFQFPFLARAKLLPRLRPHWSDPGVKRLLKLMVPALFGVSVVQINLLLITVFASFLQSGSVSWLYYADRLMNFPLGVFGVALATVVLPNLARGYALKSQAAYTQTLDWALRIVLLLGIPAGVGLFCFSGPLITTLFNYHAFAAQDVMQTKPTLMAYSVGIVAFILVKILAAACYARQDIRTPVRGAVVALIANAILCLLLIGPFKQVGLALAIVLAAWANAGMLLCTLIKRRLFAWQPGWLLFCARIGLANAVMVLVIGLSSGPLSQWLVASWSWRAVHLLAIVLLAMASYFVSLWASGLRFTHIRPPKPINRVE